MSALISTAVGGVLGVVVVLGGVATYQAVTISDTQQTSPTNVGYADE